MGSPSQTTDTTSSPNIPSFLLPYYQNTARQLIGAQKNLPNISALFNMVPLLNIPGLTPDMSNVIQGFQRSIGLNEPELASSGGLEQFLGAGPGGASTATQAALKEFRDITAPEIQQQAVLQGQGNSGASLDALARAQEQAIVPFMQQDLQNQLSAAGQLGQLGLGEASQIQQQLINALQAAGIPRDIALQQAQALFNQQQERFNFARGIQTGAQPQFPALFGNQSQSTTSQSKF